MSRFTSKQALLDEIVAERRKLEALLDQIPPEAKELEVTDGMSVKDFLAHRTEWGRMMLRWYAEARAGGTPAVPSEKYKWNQLVALNREIFERFHDTDLAEIEAAFTTVHDELYQQVEQMSEEELMTKHHYAFTGSSDLATYVNSSSAAHYRSARKHIAKWWKQQVAAQA